MYEALAHQPQIPARNPIHSAWDWLSLPVITTCNEGMLVTTPDFDAELHVETTTIMFADVVESVRLIEQDELGNVMRIRALLRMLAVDVVPIQGGAVLERRGDGLLLKFPTPRAAVACALRMHAETAVASNGEVARNVISLRIGIHSTEVFTDDVAIFGTGINAAARVMSLAGVGETLVSGATRDELVDGVDGAIRDLGERFVKHASQPLHVFRVSSQFTPATLELPALDAVLPTIAVLPMRCVARLETQAVSDVLSEALVHLLSRSDRLHVVSWLSSRPYAGRQFDARVVAASLGTNWLVSGTVYVTDQRILACIELVDADGLTQWSTRANGDVDDLLCSDSLLAAELAQAISQRMMEAEAKRVVKHALPTLKSHTLLSGAIGLMHRSSRDNFQRSLDAFEQLLERHPRMHAVRPWVAQWYVLNTTRGYVFDRAGDAAKAIDQTARALDAQPTDSFAMAMQGFAHCHLNKDMDRADSLLNQSIAVNQNESLAWLFRTTVCGALGQHEEAWLSARRALTLAPLDPQRYYFVGLAAGAAYFAGKRADAMRLAREAIRINGMHAATLRIYLYTLVESGALAEAQQVADRLLRLHPEMRVTDFKRRSIQPTEIRERLAGYLLQAGIPS